MQCQIHSNKLVSHKCLTCHKFACPECSRLHLLQKHDVITSLQLADMVTDKITEQINKINIRLSELATLREYDSGESVIDGCMNQLLDFVTKLFMQIKNEYRKISDRCWKNQNKGTIDDIQHKKNVLQQWRQTVAKKPERSILFDADRIYQNNKIDSDEELIDSSQSYILNNMAPKVMFNETALRRANESLTKIIYAQAKSRSSLPKKIKNSSSKKNLIANPPKYSSLCKFVEGSNILFEYVITDADQPESELALSKVQFRQFVTPFRSVSLAVGSSLYLIGGQSTSGRAPRKQIYLYQRSYTSMRIVGLLKEGRIGHTACSSEQIIYIYGGKGVKSLEIFNTKTKIGEIIAETKQEIFGASIIVSGDKLYIFGGTDRVDLNKILYCYNLSQRRWDKIVPINNQIYSMPISPILQCLNEHQILIMGGYFTFGGQSYNNNYIILFDDRLNSYSVYGKGELIYPLVANGNNSTIKDNKIYCLAELKRQRHRHGPNMPVIFSYNLTEQIMQLDSIGF